MRKHKSAVAAFLLASALTLGPVSAQEGSAADLLDQLAQAEDENAANRLERQVRQEWSKSGSATMDLLLKRGQDSLDVDNIDAALEHLTALTDHAPDFAEGWHMRAMAYAEAELFGPAVADLERALSIEPRHYHAIASLGGILAQVDRPDMAKRAFEEVLAIYPGYQDVIEALEHVERQIGGSTL